MDKACRDDALDVNNVALDNKDNRQLFVVDAPCVRPVKRLNEIAPTHGNGSGISGELPNFVVKSGSVSASRQWLFVFVKDTVVKSKNISSGILCKGNCISFHNKSSKASLHSESGLYSGREAGLKPGYGSYLNSGLSSSSSVTSSSFNSPEFISRGTLAKSTPYASDKFLSTS